MSRPMDVGWLCKTLCLMSVWIVAVAGGSTAMAATDAPTTIAHVAGFERFARHDEISQVDAGRLLISELSCVACHASDDPGLQPKRGPRLDSAGLRLQQSWIKRFLIDPANASPGTTMPAMLTQVDAAERSTVARQLAAYVASLQKPLPEIQGSGAVPVPHQFWLRGNIDRGRSLYHQVGCVACHAPDEQYEAAGVTDSPLDRLLDELDPDQLAEMGLAGAARRVTSIPHGKLSAKYTVEGLTLFLLDPAATRSGGRMPDFKLMPTEAADLAAYLMSLPASQPREAIASESNAAAAIAAGREWFGKLNCHQCHTTGDKFDAQPITKLAALRREADHGCLSPADDSPAKYRLDDLQTAAIATALASRETNSSVPVAATLQQTLLQLNCFACHQRDEMGGVGRYRKNYFETVAGIDLGDEGRLPPPLTGVGHKLQSSWMRKVLAGQNADIRRHMHIRMPKFPATIVEALPKQFAEVDQPETSSPLAPITEPAKFAEAGRQLMDVGCVQCHSFGGYALPGVVGVDLSGVTSRVRREWFHRFIRDPGSLKARTRMPTFFPDGQSQQPQILGGDVDHQITAIWAYLSQMEKQPLPEKIRLARSQNYELKPTEKPILLRTFMPDAGTHAIAVGYPAGIHLAFDAENCRLASGWQGRFLDAQGTWFIRFAPPAEPLADQVRTLQPGVPWAVLPESATDWPNDPPATRFGGYRLDDDGVPTFLYRIADVDIEDRIVPDQQGGLHRTIRLHAATRNSTANPLWLAVHQGPQVDTPDGQTSTDASGLKVIVTGDTAGSPQRFSSADATILAVPVRPSETSQLEVHYQW